MGPREGLRSKIATGSSGMGALRIRRTLWDGTWVSNGEAERGPAILAMPRLTKYAVSKESKVESWRMRACPHFPCSLRLLSAVMQACVHVF
jgi:hypothetical protein